jgi:hypothetical protein
MTIITFPSTKDTIDKIRYAIGRPVHFYTENETVCSACSRDPVTGNTTNPFCNVCSGIGYIYTYNDVMISAHITWGGVDGLNWVTGGQFMEGDVRLQIEYTPYTLNLVNTVDYIVVDARKVVINKKILRGAQPLNRILLDCSLEE